MNSRAKGCRGEREFRDVLREAGYCKAIRGQQFHGGPESPDVNCPELPEIHFEVKRVEKGNPHNWVDQCESDAKPNQYRVVAHKKNNKRWLAIMPMNDFLEIVRRSELPTI
jgi:hypothetical protein